MSKTASNVVLTSCDNYAKLSTSCVLVSLFSSNKMAEHENNTGAKTTTSDVRTEQRAVIKFCTNTGMTPSDTYKFMARASGEHKACRSLVYKWHRRFTDGRTTIEDDSRCGRPSFKDAATIKKIKDVILTDRRKSIDEIAECVNLNRVYHQDNAPSHTARDTLLTIDLIGFERLQHSPYSPDLAPMDFAVFPRLKSELRGRRFENLDELRLATRSVVSHFEKDWYREVFDKWVDRHKRCITAKGEYFEKE